MEAASPPSRTQEVLEVRLVLRILLRVRLGKAVTELIFSSYTALDALFVANVITTTTPPASARMARTAGMYLVARVDQGRVPAASAMVVVPRATDRRGRMAGQARAANRVGWPTRIGKEALPEQSGTRIALETVRLATLEVVLAVADLAVLESIFRRLRTITDIRAVEEVAAVAGVGAVREVSRAAPPYLWSLSTLPLMNSLIRP